MSIQKSKTKIPEEEEADGTEARYTDITTVDMNSTNLDYWKKVAFTIKHLADTRKDEMMHWRQRYMEEHQRNLSQTQMFEELSNETRGFLRKRSIEIPKFVLEEVCTLFAAHKDINEVIREIKPKNWLNITRNMVLLGLGGVFIFFTATNAKFQAFLSANAMWISFIAVSSVVLYLYWDRRTK